MAAVRDILVHEHGSVPYLVFGPPGTGKTMVMIESVLQALTHVHEPRLLVCAPSNAAADVIAKRLVYLMPEAAKRRQALADTMAAEAKAAEDGIALEVAKAEIIKERKAGGKPTQPFMAMLRLNSQSRTRASVPIELLAYCKEDVETGMFTVPSLAELKSKSVIVATCGATRLLFEAGLSPVQFAWGNHHPAHLARLSKSLTSAEAARGLQNMEAIGHFTHVLVDEASQGLEAELMCALAFAYPGCSAALCGDHKQLGPVVRSPFAREHGLSQSMLERLMTLPLYKSCLNPAAAAAAELGSSPASPAASARSSTPPPRTVTKLIRNYRSHGALLELPSRVSYDSELLECADSAVTNSMGGWGELVTSGFPLLFYGCSSAHSLYKIDPSSAHPSSSYRNVTEAEKLVELVSSLLGLYGGDDEDDEAQQEDRGGAEAHANAAAPSAAVDVTAARSPTGSFAAAAAANLSEEEQLAWAMRESLRDEEERAEEQRAAQSNGKGGKGGRGGRGGRGGGAKAAAPPSAAPPSAPAASRPQRITTNDIGVVTPFRAQVLHLRQQLRKVNLGGQNLGNIRVGTVDDYQGQEEKIIIISTVIGSANARAVQAMAHGLMSSPQRFNVAITRAKALLVVIGDPNALWEDASWRELLQYAVDNHSYKGVAHPLCMAGAEDDSFDSLSAIINQVAQRSLLGAGASSAMFPGLLGGASSIWGGDGDDLDEDLGWRMY